MNAKELLEALKKMESDGEEMERFMVCREKIEPPCGVPAVFHYHDGSDYRLLGVDACEWVGGMPTLKIEALDVDEFGDY